MLKYTYTSKKFEKSEKIQEKEKWGLKNMYIKVKS